ncbi:ribosome biogenesis protein noc4 [Moniliophthora roreri MCA 2997]|uniref:Ribosome biogenesis protein noc4 n=1 Tax=Moniliophthora roreri (strain MCA 2997) TaxID=1381753 RepID=V2WBG0_MONRO|nr:ribosome biogenesis protein noc4 [Moniliophthora roreri MCA 2997]KAI3597809.1 ribosome biogenesis protein noc4 [Moniliophthora roreri]
MPIPVRSLPPPAKKRKIEPSKTAQNVQKLEDQISEAVSKNASLNALADLVELACTATQAEDVSKAIYALYRTFVTIIHRGNFVLAGDENAKVVKTWLWDQLNTYVEFLAGLLQDDEKSLRTSALQVLMSLQKHLSTSFSEHSSPPNPQFHASHFRRIVNALLLCPSSSRKAQEGSSSDRKLDPEVLNMFHDTWFSVHDDIRWFFLREAGSIMSKITTEQQHYVSGNLLSILERLNTFPTESAELNAWWVEELGIKPPKTKRQKIDGSNESDEEDEPTNENEEEEDDWRKFFDDDTTMKTAPKAKAPAGRVHTLTVHQSLHSLQSHRAVFTRAWLSLLPKLSIQGDASATKALALRALNVMHRGVLPHLTRPVLVMDWIGACVDYGGAVGLLALNALYALMKEYNLDYPSFYTRLYAFLDRDVLHLKHRARFFRMTELFLSSTHLPATLLASFVKRLARLSLTAPPAAIVMVLPFTYNILKRHPALMPMIHRDGDISSDPFNASEINPLLTDAISSSLWEIQTHRSHYHSAVSTLAKIFSEAFTKPKYSMEDFLDHTYVTLFDAEANRKIKKEPALAVELDQQINLFGKTDAVGVVGDLWTFEGL